MKATIEISNDLLEKLDSMKTDKEDTYEDIIWDLIEDRMELSEQTKKVIANAEKDIKEGRVVSFEAFKKELNLS